MEDLGGATASKQFKLRFQLSYALIYVFAAGCLFFTVLRIGSFLLGGPEYALRFLFDMSYTSNGTGFERRLFWTGLSGIPVLALALLTPSLSKRRSTIALIVRVALSILPAVIYASMYFAWIEAVDYAISVNYDFRFFALNYWPTSLSLICYAYICIDRIVRHLASGQAK